jgi:PTS hybrid protein
MHTGFVGPGMLDAARTGEVFTSPVPDQVVAATRGVVGGLGTDATAIADAVSAADDGAGVVVLMDLGSAVLAAETALELVEGLVGAAVRDAAGAALESVAQEALRGLAPKQAHLRAP